MEKRMMELQKEYANKRNLMNKMQQEAQKMTTELIMLEGRIAEVQTHLIKSKEETKDDKKGKDNKPKDKPWRRNN